MKSYLSYSLLSVRRQKRQSILIGVVVACFVAATFVVYLFADSNNKGGDVVNNATIGSHNASYLEISRSELDALKRLSFVDKLLSVPLYATYYNPNQEVYTYNRLDFAYLDDALKEKWNYKITHGKEPGYLEIALNENAVKYLEEFELNKTVTVDIKIASRIYPISLKVSGLYECDIDKLEYAVIDEQTRQQFVDKAGGIYIYDAYLYFDGGESINDRVEQIEALGIAEGRNSRKVNGYDVTKSSIFLQYQFLLLFIFLVLPCSFLVMAVFYIHLKNNEKHYAMLRDMGAEKRRLKKIILLQMLYIYLFSFPAGAAAGSLTMKMLLDINSIKQSIYHKPLIFDLEISAVIYLFVFCPIIIFLFIMPVVSRFATKISKDGLLVNSDLYVAKSSRILTEGHNFSLSYSLLNTIRSRKTALKYVWVITLFFVILMSSSFIVNLFNVVSTIDSYYGYDFVVSGDGDFGEGYWKISEPTYEKLKQLPFIGEIRRESVTYLRKSPESESELLRGYNAVIRGFDLDLLKVRYADYISQGDMEKLSVLGNVGLLSDSLISYYRNHYNSYVTPEGKIVEISDVNDAFFDEINKPGATINFGTGNINVAAIFKDYPRETYHEPMIAFVSDMDNYARITGDTSYYSLYIKCSDSSPEAIKNADEALSALKKPLRLNVINTADTMERNAEDLADTNLIFKYLYIVILVIVSLTAAALASFYIESKSEERDTLYSIGCERGMMVKIQLLEFNNIALSGCILGLPISYLMYKIFIKIANAGEAVPKELSYPLWLSFTTMVIIYTLSIMSGWIKLTAENKRRMGHADKDNKSVPSL